MATQGDRSLSSGMPIPKWMKSKMNDKLDFGQTAFSPTELDDSFMYYYRSQGAREDNSQIITSNLTDKISVSQVSNTKVDFSKHPTPCQKYIHSINDASNLPHSTSQMKIKSQGTDDGFKGEAAKCGSSIIRVANQMVSGRVVHGFSIKEDESCEQNPTMERYDVRKRRGSKSLPASPLSTPNSSPKSNRRAVNKYFTAAFTDTDRAKGSWILSNLLARREMSQSVSHIGEAIKEELEHSASAASSDDVSALRHKTEVFKAKPSELREMNFWSPTSM